VSDEGSLKSDSLSKQETQKLFQMLEVKLNQERRTWQRKKSQIRVVRALSFLFLFALIAAVLIVFYMIQSRAQEHRLNKPEQTTQPAR
jgi:hypothetical protein